MTVRSLEFMRLDRCLFPRDVAESLVKLLEQKGKLTSKQRAARYGIDQTTAENLRRGVLSLQTLIKIVLREGRELWNALGDEIFDETQEQWEERLLQQRIEEGSHAQERLVRLRARREDVEARATNALAALDGAPVCRTGLRNG